MKVSKKIILSLLISSVLLAIGTGVTDFLLENKHTQLLYSIRSAEGPLFETLEKIDEDRKHYIKYRRVVNSFENELRQLDRDYDAIPDGTTLYRRNGAFISRSEYKNEEWERIKERRSQIKFEKNNGTLPELRHVIVLERSAIVAATTSQDIFVERYANYLEARDVVFQKYGHFDREIEQSAYIKYSYYFALLLFGLGVISDIRTSEEDP